MPARAIAVLLCTLTLLSWDDSAGQSAAATIQENLEATLGQDALPGLQTVVPGYRPAQVAPGIVVGVFVSHPGQPAEWGLALSEIVRDLLAHLPEAALQRPFTSWEALKQDGFHPGHDPSGLLSNLESLQTVGARLGIASGLLGELDLRESDFSLTLTWYDLGAGTIEATEQLTGTIDVLPGLPSTVAGTMYRRLGHELTSRQREYLESAAELTLKQLRGYVELVTRWRQEGAASAAPLARRLTQSAPRFASAATASLELAGYDGEGLELIAFVNELADRFPDHSGVQLAAAQRWYSERDERSLRAREQWLQAILADDPNSMQTMWAYAETLLESDRAAEAVSIALEVLARWPDNYRSWWLCAEATRRLAWKTRGSVEDYTEAIEFGTDTFLPLLKIADEAVDTALLKHPHSSPLWRLKIETNPGYSAKMLQAFRRAVEYDPHNYYAYQSALIYSAPKWGGSVPAQEEVYRLALENNPGEQWPHQLYQSLTGVPPAAATAGTPDGNEAEGGRKTAFDYLEQASEMLGCEGNCISEIKTLAKIVGLISLALVILAAARSSNVETLTPPGATRDSRAPYESSDDGVSPRRRGDRER